MANVKIVFDESRTVLDHAGEVEAAFEAGKTYALPAASADRWIRRGVAHIRVAPAKTSANATDE